MEQNQEKIYLDETLISNKTYYNSVFYHVDCIICHLLIIDPIMCSKCETTFCKVCIESWNIRDANCPKCRSVLELININLTKKDIFDNLLLYCKYGCQVPLLSYEKHYKTCDNPNKVPRIPRFGVIGVSGKGKSTFLNFLSDTLTFKTGSSLQSVTQKKASYHGMYNDNKYCLIDLPGICAMNMTLSDWLNEAKVKDVDAIFWVRSVLDRATNDDITMYSAMFECFKVKKENLILVLTHCDLLDQDVLDDSGYSNNFEGFAQNYSRKFIQECEKNIKISIEVQDYLYFGKKETTIFKPKYKENFTTILKRMIASPVQTVSVKETISANQLNQAIFNNLSDNLRKKLNICKKCKKEIDEKNRYDKSCSVHPKYYIFLIYGKCYDWEETFFFKINEEGKCFHSYI